MGYTGQHCSVLEQESLSERKEVDELKWDIQGSTAV